MDDMWGRSHRRDSDEDQIYADQLKVALADAMVMSIFFVRVGYSMILDFRTMAGVNPTVMVDRMSTSLEERVISIQHLRPELPVPEEIVLAPWFDRVRDFEQSGVLDRLLVRCDEVGGGALMLQARESYAKLLSQGNKMLREMLTGVGTETIWERPSTR